MVNQIPCPQCGAPNRPGARFCQRCRAPLSVAGGTMKTCPQCGTPNRVAARFCANCHHAFSAPAGKAPGIPRWLWIVGGLSAAFFALLMICGVVVFVAQASGWLVISTTPGTATRVSAIANTPSVTPMETPTPTVTISATPTLTAIPQPTPTATLIVDVLDRAERATVQIRVPIDAKPGYASSGSGTVITKRGHILTNNHIFVDETTGKPYNARGDIFIAFPPPSNLKGKAQIVYRAVIVQADEKNDLALLKISETRDNKPLPADLELGVVPIGDSDAVKIGDSVFVIGYPGLGGDTITLTRGVIAGFMPDDGLIKTDAEVNPGNSGGGAYNALYELIGIPSELVSSRLSVGKIGLIRPIKLARALIERARRDAGE